MAINIQSDEKQRPTPKITLLSKAKFRIKEQIKSFPDEKKLKEFITTKLLLYEILKGLFFKREKKIKNMNYKIAINTYLSTIESRTK